jgi:uracil-DNA glycosylase
MTDMVDFDPGPPASLARQFAGMPSYGAHRDLYWYDWGPVFYRGRLNRTARLLVIASDPGPTERIVGRTLVGDAGQRVQGFLTKLGLTRSYVLLNAFPLALHPSQSFTALRTLADEPHRRWRNRVYSSVCGPELQAIVAFGLNAQEALRQWAGHPDVPVFELPHPSSHDARALLDAWRAAVPALRAVVTPDPDGSQTGPTYGTSFAEEDYSAVPAADLPFGVPSWVGNDHWGRTASPRHNNCVSRPATDPDHGLVWQAPHDTP